MIRLIALNNPRIAQSFIDYMASRDIEILMTPEGEGQFALWLKQTEHQIEVEAELSYLSITLTLKSIKQLPGRWRTRVLSSFIMTPRALWLRLKLKLAL